MNADIMQQKKVRHVNCLLQKDDASSKEKRSPPIGAPKAAATPIFVYFSRNQLTESKKGKHEKRTRPMR